MTLTLGQFLLLLFGLAASIYLGFPIQTRHLLFSLPMRALVTLVWGVSWVLMSNALVEWIVHPFTRLTMRNQQVMTNSAVGLPEGDDDVARFRSLKDLLTGIEMI